MPVIALLLALSLFLPGSPAWAQATPPAPAGTVPPAQPEPQPYSWQLLGIQSPGFQVPGTLPPPTPPPASQSHVPSNLPITVPTTFPVISGAPFELHPSLGFSEQYSHNFRISSQSKVHNFRCTLTPRLSLLINGPRTQGVVPGSLGVVQDSVNSVGDLAIFSSLSVTAFAASQWFGLSLPLIFLVGLSQQSFMVTNFTLVQTLVPDHLRGRVLSIRMIIFGLTPVGQIIFGAIAQSIGASLTVGAAGVIAAVLMLLVTLSVPRLRKLR